MKGYETREVMLSKSGLFKAPLLLTFTVDRHGTVTGRGFKNPEAAHTVVAGQKFIPRMMRLAGVKRWLWVLEFQTKTGDGWPHWHVMVDASDWGGRLPQEVLERIWGLWRDKWRVGLWDVEKSDFANPEHAVRYITKYLVKQPEAGYPVWVLQSTSVVRLVGGSRAVGALTWGGGVERDEVEDGDGVEGRKVVPLVDRLVNCSQSVVVVKEDVCVTTGEVVGSYVGQVEVSPACVIGLVEDGEVEGEVVEVEGERGKRWRRVVLTERGVRQLWEWKPSVEEECAVLSWRSNLRGEILGRWSAYQDRRAVSAC